jgi:hypothetical protein
MVRAAAVMAPWLATGARPVALPRLSRLATRLSSARTVRTRSGYALFDEAGRYVGRVAEPAGRLSFGAGADTVLLRRTDGN